MANTKNYTNHKCGGCSKSFKKYPTGLATLTHCATCAPKFAEAEAERLREEARKATGLSDKELQKKARREALDARDLAIVSAVLSGSARKTVADQFKVSQSLIHEALIAHGYKRPVKNQERAARDQAIIEAVDSGKSQEEVAAEFKMSANRVRLIYAARNAKPLPKAGGESAAA